MPTCREPSTVRAPAWLQVWLLGLALGAALWLPGTEALGQTAGAVSLRVRSDSRRTADFAKDDDGWNAYYTYTVRADGDGLKAELSSRQIVGIWKRGATVREQGFNRDGYIESLRQFAPVFLIAELTNDGQRSAQITAAYLDVSDSATDFEPYLEIGDWARLGCGEGTYDPKFELRNLGWGEVRDARMLYAFRGKGSGQGAGATPEFEANLGMFDQKTDPTVEDGLRRSGLNVGRARSETFRCPAESQIPACFSRLKATGLFGNLANHVYTDGNKVLTTVAGRFGYRWADHLGRTNDKETPFEIAIPILHFDVGGPECGAPAPADRDLKPIRLSLGHKGYRLPLNWRGQLAPRQNQSFGFALVAEKSSRHVFRVVLQLADGNTIASKPVELSYFLPRMPPPPEDKEE